MINKTVILITVIFICLMVLTVSALAEKPKQSAENIKTEDKIDSQAMPSDINQIYQTKVIDQDQTNSITESANLEPVAPPTRAGEEINWQVISGGGTDGSSTNYILLGTVGQAAVGEGGSTSYTLKHGYWQGAGLIGPCDCEPGEANGVSPKDILDIVYIINFKYKGGPAAIPYALCNADTNCNCVIDILDIVYLINWKYKGGPDVCTCEVWVSNCGTLR